MFRDDGLDQGCRTYGTRHSLLYQFLLFIYLFILLNQRICSEEYVCMYVRMCICVCIHIHLNAKIVHELPLLPNNTSSEAFLHKSGEMWCVDWIFNHRGAGLVVTSRIYDTGQNSLLFKQKVQAAPITSKFSSLPHSSRIPLFEL